MAQYEYMTISEFSNHLSKWIREHPEYKNHLVCKCSVASEKDEDEYVPGSVLIALGTMANDEGWEYDGTLNITQTVLHKYKM